MSYVNNSQLYDDNGALVVTSVPGSGGASTGANAAQSQGTAAAGATAVGNPSRAAGVARPFANKQIRTNGQVADITTDENENQWVRESYAPLYEDNVAQVAKVEQRYASQYISTATTTTVKTGSGHLHTLVIGETAAGTITVYDNTAASGTVIAVLKASIVEGTYQFNCSFTTGLTIVTAAASKLTVTYR